MPRLWPAVYTGLFLLFGCFYLGLAHRLPFDQIWDMDLISVNDALLINSQQFPLHIDHPKFGMHVLTSLALHVGRMSGLISVANYADLSRCPSPALCMAELVLYLRQVEALISCLNLTLAGCLLWLLFPRQRSLGLLSLPLLGLQTGLLYNSLTMRTEDFSVCFLLLGCVSFVGIYQRSRRGAPQLETLAWLTGGVGFGLALLTKLQALQAAPLFLAICCFTYLEPDTEPELTAASNAEFSARARQMQLALTLALSLLWLGLAAVSWFKPSLPGQVPVLIPFANLVQGQLSLVSFLTHLKLQMVWLLLIFATILSLALSGRKLPGQRFYRGYPWFWCGLCLAFALPMLTYLGQPGWWPRGWAYLVQMAQTSIWTDTNASTSASAGEFFPTLRYLLITDKTYLLLALGVLLIALLRLRELKQAGTDRLLGLVIFFAGTPLLLLGSRGVYRDTIWFKFLGCLGILMLAYQLWSELRTRRLLRALLLSCLLIPLLCSAWQLPDSIAEMQLYFAKFKSNRYASMMTAVYASPEMDYARILRTAYGNPLPDRGEDRDILRRAVGQARLLEPLKHMADTIFAEPRLPVRSLGLAEVQMPVWWNGHDWARFSRLAPTLSGGLLFNPAELDAQRPLTLAPIWDGDLLLCISGQDYQRLFQLNPNREQAALQIRDGKQILDYYPIEVDGNTPYAHENPGFKGQAAHDAPYPTSRFSGAWFASFIHPAFFLIRNGNAWGPAYPKWENLESMLETSPAATP